MAKTQKITEKMGTPISVRFGKGEADMIRTLRAHAKVSKRSVSEQIKYYAHLGMVAKDNPDLPMSLIEGILEGREESSEGLSVPYPWGIVR